MSTPGSIEFQLREKITELSQYILARHPRLPNLLSEIQKTLLQYPEQVVLMSEEDIQVLVSRLEQQTGIELAKATLKTSTSKSLTQKLKILTKDDL